MSNTTVKPGDATVPVDKAAPDPYRDIKDAFSTKPADYFKNYLERTGHSRLVLETPNPLVTFSLGRPHDNFGYMGLSIRAEHHMFVDIAKRGRFQFGEDVVQITQRSWSLHAMQDIAQCSDKNMVIASRRKAIISAGGGYGMFADLPTGNMPANAPFNATEFNDVVDPARWGLRDFDKEIERRNGVNEYELGYQAKPPPPPPLPLPIGKLAALLGADATPATASQPSIDRILDISSIALLSMLKKATRIADRVSMWASRPDMAPLVGPLILDKVKKIKEATRTLNEIVSVPEFVPAVANVGKIWDKQSDKMAADKKKGDWITVIATDWRVLLTQPIRDFKTQLTRLKTGIKELVELVASILGLMAPAPSALGLVGKDGVTMITQADMLAWAPKGFHFISAKNAKDWPMDAATRFARWLKEKEQDLRDKAGGAYLANFLFGKQIDNVDTPPKFVVETEGCITMRAIEDITLSGVGPASTVRLESWSATEVASLGPVGVSSRREVVEVMGREVRLGIPKVDTAKDAAKKAIALAPAEAAAKATKAPLETARKMYIKLRKKVWDLDEEIRGIEARIELKKKGIPTPTKVAQVRQLSAKKLALTAQREILMPQLKARSMVLVAARQADTVAEKSLETARTPVAITGAVAEALDWDPKRQALTSSLSAAATKSVEVFGGESVKVESQKSIVLETDKLGAKKATITVETEVELKVGNFVVTVAKNKVTITAGAGKPVLTVDGSGITLDGGGKAIKLKNAGTVGATATGNVKLEGGKIMLG